MSEKTSHISDPQEPWRLHHMIDSEACEWPPTCSTCDLIAEALTAAEARGRQQAEQDQFTPHMAAGLLMQLKLEAEKQHARAEQAETIAADAKAQNERLIEHVQQAEQALSEANAKIEDARTQALWAADYQRGTDERVAALTQALKDYGQHKPECLNNADSWRVGQPIPRCTCGLDDALIEAQPRICINHEGYSGPTSKCPTCRLTGAQK